MKRRRRRKIRYPKRRLPLNDQHRRAIALLADVPTKTYEEISAELGINRRTLYRWRARPDFDRELRKEINRRWEAYRKTLPKPGMLAYLHNGDIDVIEWFFHKAGFVSDSGK